MKAFEQKSDGELPDNVGSHPKISSAPPKGIVDNVS